MNTGLFLIINSWAGQNIWLDQLMVFSADWLGYLLIAGIILLFFKNRSKYKDMLLVSSVSAIMARFVFTEAIRYFYYYPRPFMFLKNVNVLVEYEAKSSFPSGHAAFYFALATGVYLYNKKAGYVYFVLAGLMGFSRIFISVHWPFDILAGAVLGMGTAYLFEFIQKKIPWRVS